LDLPTVAEMLEQIRGGKLLTRIIARRLRPDLLKLEGDIKELAALVDGFYDLLRSVPEPHELTAYERHPETKSRATA